MWKLSCIVQVSPRCNHKCLYKRKAQGGLASKVGDVMVKSRGWSDARSGAKICRRPPELKHARKQIFPLEPPGGNSSTYTLTLAHEIDLVLLDSRTRRE